MGLSGVFWDVLGFFRNLWSSMGFYDVMFMVFIWIFFWHSSAFFWNLLQSLRLFRILQEGTPGDFEQSRRRKRRTQTDRSLVLGQGEIKEC